MKKKITWFEMFYFVLSIYCLWASQELFSATVKQQGTSNASVFDPALLFVGALAPITTIGSSLPVSGLIVGVFILLTPLIGLIAYKDFKKKLFGTSCFVFTMLITSTVVTGTLYSLTAGVGGLISLFVIAILFAIAIINTTKEEVQKQLKFK